MTTPGLLEQPLASALTVGPCRIEEVAAERDGPIERAQRLLVLRSRPPGHAPHAVSDLGNLPTGAAERSIAHAADVSNRIDAASACDRNLSATPRSIVSEHA